MAFGTPTDGGAAYLGGNANVSPAYPASIAAGDCLVLIVGQKPSTANGGTVTTPSGWTLREELLAAGGYGTGLAADTGNTNLRIYTKDTVAGNETGNLAVTVGTNNICWAIIVRIPANGGTLSYGTADGSRTTAPTSGTAFTTLLTNGTTAPNFEADDMAIWAMCIPTDVLNNGFTAPTISSTGATFGTPVELEEPDSGTNLDIGGYVAYAECTSGSSTAAPTVGVTATGTVTNVRGPIALIRVRETLPTRTGSMDATETGTDTFSGEGNVLVSGSLAATETGDDTFSASGTVADPSVTGSMAATETGDDTFAGAGNVLVSGSLSATETGDDTFAGSGNVLVSGSLSATETGTDAFSGQGFLTQQGITGSMSATETGDDAASASGKVLVFGAMSVTETGDDTASINGNVRVSGSLDAFEVGQDVCLSDGTVLVSGALMAQEAGNDTFLAQGSVVGDTVTGSMSATEAGSDTLGSYVNEGYVLDGYVDTGIIATLSVIQGRPSKKRFKKTAFIQPGLAPTRIEINSTATVSGAFAISSCANVIASGTIIVNGIAQISAATLNLKTADIQARSYGNTTEEELLLLLLE